MSFDSVQKWVAFSSQLLSNADAMAGQLGADFNGVVTLAIWDDNLDKGTKRAARASVDFAPIPLTDGRFAGRGYWSVAAITAIESDVIEGAEILTDAKVFELKPIETNE